MPRLHTLSSVFADNENECFGFPSYVVLEGHCIVLALTLDIPSIVSIILGDAFIDTVRIAKSSERVMKK